MLLPTIHFIHINDTNKHLRRRKEQFTKEAKTQGCEFGIVDAVVNKDLPYVGCTKSHKKAVRYARSHDMPFIVIAEDDCVFSDKAAYEYFIETMPKEFDMYFGMVYKAKTSETGKIRSTFHGTTMYAIHSRFYDEFLLLDESTHLDYVLSQMTLKKLFYVCLPMVCYQNDKYSFVKKSMYNVTKLAKDLNLFNGKSS